MSSFTVAEPDSGISRFPEDQMTEAVDDTEEYEGAGSAETVYSAVTSPVFSDKGILAVHPEVPKSAPQEVTDSTLQEVPKPALQEVPESAPLMNQTDKNQTYRSYKDSYRIVSTGRGIRSDAMRSEDDSVRSTNALRQLIKENIDYDALVRAHEEEREMIDGIVDLIMETVLTRSEYTLIASNQYPAAVVRSKFLKLKYAHIDYVLYCLQRNTTKVNNIRKYLLAALFNAPSTMNGYYQAEVQHDMPQLALSGNT